MGNELPQRTNSKPLVWCVLLVSYYGVTLSEAQWLQCFCQVTKICDCYGRKLKPKCEFSVDKHVPAKPVPFPQGGGRKRKLYFLRTFCVCGGEVHVRTKPDAEPTIVPFFSRWYGIFISFHIYFFCFREKNPKT